MVILCVSEYVREHKEHMFRIHGFPIWHTYENTFTAPYQTIPAVIWDKRLFLWKRPDTLRYRQLPWNWVMKTSTKTFMGWLSFPKIMKVILVINEQQEA